MRDSGDSSLAIPVKRPDSAGAQALPPGKASSHGPGEISIASPFPLLALGLGWLPPRCLTWYLLELGTCVYFEQLRLPSSRWGRECKHFERRILPRVLLCTTFSFQTRAMGLESLCLLMVGRRPTNRLLLRAHASSV